jgi:hypothetical protein
VIRGSLLLLLLGLLLLRHVGWILGRRPAHGASRCCGRRELLLLLLLERPVGIVGMRSWRLLHGLLLC